MRSPKEEIFVNKYFFSWKISKIFWITSSLCVPTPAKVPPASFHLKKSYNIPKKLGNALERRECKKISQPLASKKNLPIFSSISLKTHFFFGNTSECHEMATNLIKKITKPLITQIERNENKNPTRVVIPASREAGRKILLFY